MLPILKIGSLALPVAPLSLLIGLWLGLSLAEKFASKRGVSVDVPYNLTFAGLVAGLIGARLGTIFQYPNAFIESPLSLFSLNPGLFDPFTGSVAGLIGLLVYGQRAKLRFWNTLDTLTPLLAVMAIGFAVGHIASGEAFGAETSLPWGINLWGATRHPTQFYELMAAVLTLGMIGIWSKNPNAPAGTLFLAFVALTAGSRLFLEAFRGDSVVVIGGLRSAQIVAWLVLAAAFIGLDRVNRKGNDYG
jgi:phosphatidylglycerol---prolipoprotein diacylglyceryl transferase